MFHRLLGATLKRAEFEKLLKSLGARLIEGGNHTKVYLNGKQTVLSRHRELKNDYIKLVKKQLNIK